MNFLENLLESINPLLWVISNVAVAYVGLLLVVFVIMYYVLFDPGATTGGRLIFRFSLSLSFVIAIVLIGIFLDPRHDTSWFEYPIADVLWWRPAARALGYGYVAYTITSLVVFLLIRKFKPHRLHTAGDKALVQPRVETTEIPTQKEGSSNGRHQ